jgi:hypothetical protein
VKDVIRLLLLFVFLSSVLLTEKGISINKNYKYNENGRIIPPEDDELKLLPKDGGQLWNRLVFEKSPYLLQHAANPVDWYPWSQEAFDLAKKLNKPIFLSIGYTTCHWCHVMEHESFEDSLVAELMNKNFINVKVDREERPDVDNIYMEVTQMVTGRGGWPMTIIMTPDKKPFFAGTYFPKNTRYNRKGMVDIIPEIGKLWMTKKDSILNSSNNIVNTLKSRKNNTSSVDISLVKVLDNAFNYFSTNFDNKYGGFKNSRNKFPKPHDYSFLVRYYNRTNNKTALNIINKSLYEMKKGGLYDQIGFGFHRYSTDVKWLVPHFEKMLYDQAMLVHAYLDAYLLTEDDFYKNTVVEVLEYVLRDMTDSGGGFYSAEDADSQGEEGTFYIWKTEELKGFLQKNDFEFIYDILELDDSGNCRVEGHYTNIPHFKMNWPEIAEKYSLSIVEAKKKFNTIRNKIFEFREKRVHPQKDDKILTDWNGLMISAFSRAGIILNVNKYIETAKNSANFIIENLIVKENNSKGKLIKSYRNGPSNIDGMIEDYAFFIWGLIELYQSTYDEKYIDYAVLLSEYQLAHFWDKDNSGFFFISDLSEDLIIRNKEIYDGAIPSGNSVSAYNFIRLGRILSKPKYEDIANDIFKAFSRNLYRHSAGNTMLLHAIDFIEGPAYEVIISGDLKKNTSLIDKINKSKQLNKVLIFNDSSKKIGEKFNFLESYFPGDNDTPLIYVCKNYVCDLPTSNIDEVLLNLLK